MTATPLAILSVKLIAPQTNAAVDVFLPINWAVSDKDDINIAAVPAPLNNPTPMT